MCMTEKRQKARHFQVNCIYFMYTILSWYFYKQILNYIFEVILNIKDYFIKSKCEVITKTDQKYNRQTQIY